MDNNVEREDVVGPENLTTIQLRRPLRSLMVRQIMRIDRMLSELGPYGEVRLVKVNGRLRFIERVESEEA